MSETDLAIVARRHGIRLLLQFGSTVSGQTHDRSDVDLAVLLDRVPTTFRARGEIAADLQTLFPGHELDLVVINTADPLLLKQVVARCRLIFGEPRALAELKIYAFRRYQDHRRFLAMEREYVRRKVAAAGR